MKTLLYYILYTQLLICSTTLYSQWSTDPYNNLIVGYGLLPEIASDSAGGCYITYEGGTTYPRQLTLHRLNRYGYKPWGSGNKILGELPDQSSAKIVEDGQNGVIISYLDVDSDNWPYIKTWLRVQRVDSSGNFLWGPTGVRVSLSETNQGDQAIVSDGDGGCVLVWWDSDTLTFNNDIRGQRLDRKGNRIWGDNGIFTVEAYYPPLLARTKTNYFFGHGRFVRRTNSDGIIMWSDSLGFRVIEMISDNLDGILVGGRSGIANNIFIISQKIDSLGNHQWPNPYLTIAESTVTNSPIIILPKLNDYTFAWNGYKDGVSDLRTQIVRSDGSTVFQYGGIPISRTSSKKGIVGVLPSDSATSLFVWADSRTPLGVYIQRLDTLGITLWDSNDVLFCDISLGGGSKLTTDGMGGCIIVGWRESDFTVRAQQVNKYGQLGQVITSIKDISNQLPLEFILYQNYPNPFNSSTIIKYETPKSDWVKIEVFDILGQKLKTLVDKLQQHGVYQITFDASDISSGVYIYKLQTTQLIQIKKLTIIK